MFFSEPTLCEGGVPATCVYRTIHRLARGPACQILGPARIEPVFRGPRRQCHEPGWHVGKSNGPGRAGP